MEYKNITLPKKLDKQTLEFITGIVDCFDQEGKLNSLDSLSIYLLASNLDQYLKCEREIRKSGLCVISDRGNCGISPYAQLQKTLMKDIIILLKELGLTLGSRTKMKVIDASDADSPLMKFLNSK